MIVSLPGGPLCSHSLLPPVSVQAVGVPGQRERITVAFPMCGCVDPGCLEGWPCVGWYWNHHGCFAPWGAQSARMNGNSSTTFHGQCGIVLSLGFCPPGGPVVLLGGRRRDLQPWVWCQPLHSMACAQGPGNGNLSHVSPSRGMPVNSQASFPEVCSLELELGPEEDM